MKKENIPKEVIITYRDLNDAKARALNKFLGYLYETEQFELVEKMQECLKESIEELYGEE